MIDTSKFEAIVEHQEEGKDPLCLAVFRFKKDADGWVSSLIWMQSSSTSGKYVSIKQDIHEEKQVPNETDSEASTQTNENPSIQTKEEVGWTDKRRS